MLDLLTPLAVALYLALLALLVLLGIVKTRSPYLRFAWTLLAFLTSLIFFPALLFMDQ